MLTTKQKTYSTTQKIVDSNDNTEESQTLKGRKQEKGKGTRRTRARVARKRRNKMEISNNG